MSSLLEVEGLHVWFEPPHAAPVHAVQVESAVRSPFRPCAFRIEAGATDEAVRAFREFERSLLDAAGASCRA